MFKKLRDTLEKWILPYTCVLCGQETPRQLDLCDDCENDLPLIMTACLKCAKEIPWNKGTFCGGCLTTTYYYDQITAAFNYQTPIKEMILKLKFHQNLLYSHLLAKLLIKKLHLQKSPLPDLIIPVPLHKNRIQQRGFNQATEIAKTIADHFNITLALNCCSRLVDTQAQSSIPAKMRHTNLKNAFVINSQKIVGKHLAIVDDVFTTGSTVNELSRMLKKAGASTIQIWCIARTNY